MSKLNEEELCCSDCGGEFVESKLEELCVDGLDIRVCIGQCLDHYVKCDGPCSNYIHDDSENLLCFTCKNEGLVR
jgi:hypothetical protein